MSAFATTPNINYLYSDIYSGKFGFGSPLLLAVLMYIHANIYLNKQYHLNELLSTKYT